MTEFEISFRLNGNSSDYVRDGWGDPEPFGRWMVGRQSRLSIPPPPWARGPFRVLCLVGPFLRAGRVDEQPLQVVVNGTAVLDISLTGVRELEFAIPDGVLAADTASDMVFVHDGAVVPAALDQGGGDLRELAVSIWSMTILGPAPPAAVTRPHKKPVFHLRSRGNLANRMIQFLVGLSVQGRAPHCALAGVELDEWGLSSHRPAPAWADATVVDEQFIDLDAVAERLSDGATAKVSYRGYGQRLENFPSLEACRATFRPVTDNVARYDERYLVINVRSGDIVAGLVPDYVLMPPNFYRELIARTRLIPVFMGQLEPNAYTASLRAAFPGAMFIMSQGPMRDFETMRRAVNLVPSVSTFSWLAAWLSTASQIHLPVNGLFNPLQFSPVDLLPTDDDRYEFHLFPVNHAVPPAELPRAHAALDGGWRSIPAAELAGLRAEARALAGSNPGRPV